MLHELIGMLYKLAGRLLMRRRCYMNICLCCRKKRVDQYFPYHGAFLWEREYWRQFQPDECCGKTMTVKRSFGSIGGALYRLPGYKRYDRETLRRLLT